MTHYIERPGFDGRSRVEEDPYDGYVFVVGRNRTTVERQVHPDYFAVVHGQAQLSVVDALHQAYQLFHPMLAPRPFRSY